MNTFIKITEIWVLNKDRTHLELKEGIYGEFTEFKAISENKQFAYHQGLPGKVWAKAEPIVIKKLQSPYYERTEAAHKAGLTCAIGMPILAGEFLMAVVVFLCGADDDNAGAIEVWTNSLTKKNQLDVLDGYYGKLDHFAHISKKTHFMKGEGLPGLVWQQEQPVIIEDLAHTPNFMRSKEAKKSGLTKGLGLPIAMHPDKIFIMSFLSAQTTPIAKRIQIWLPNKEHTLLNCQTTHGQENNDLANLFEVQNIKKGSGLMGRAWLTGVPVIGKSTINQDASDPAAISSLLAIPITNKGILKSVVTFLF